MSLFGKGEVHTYIVGVYGMKCGMCEAHVNDIIRNNFNVKKVKSSHIKNQTIIESKYNLDLEKVKKAIASAGYEVKDITVE